MRRLLGDILYTVYCVLFLTIVGVGLLVITPYLIGSTLREKWRAMKRGRPVNWHIFREGL